VNTEALPPLAPGAIPAEVKSAGPQAVERFRSGLAFERQLLSQLLTEALPEEEEGAEPRAASLPQTLADAIVSQGGAGIAGNLFGDPSAYGGSAAKP
jgi:hypothetical protein